MPRFRLSTRVDSVKNITALSARTEHPLVRAILDHPLIVGLLLLLPIVFLLPADADRRDALSRGRLGNAPDRRVPGAAFEWRDVCAQTAAAVLADQRGLAADRRAGVDRARDGPRVFGAQPGPDASTHAAPDRIGRDGAAVGVDPARRGVLRGLRQPDHVRRAAGDLRAARDARHLRSCRRSAPPRCTDRWRRNRPWHSCQGTGDVAQRRVRRVVLRRGGMRRI